MTNSAFDLGRAGLMAAGRDIRSRLAFDLDQAARLARAIGWKQAGTARPWRVVYDPACKAWDVRGPRDELVAACPREGDARLICELGNAANSS